MSTSAVKTAGKTNEVGLGSLVLGTGLTLGGAITNGGALTKIGAGTLTLSGANTTTNATTVSEGTLEVGSTTALGVGRGTQLIIAPGATVKLSANVTVNALVEGDIPKASGTWGAPGNAGVSHTSASFTGSGVLTVTPLGTLIRIQ